MKRRKFLKSFGAVATVFLGLGGLGCYGKFGLVRKLYGLGDHIENKWVKAALFILLLIIPILPIMFGGALLFDMLIFNAIEFWTEKNPLVSGSFNQRGEHRKIVRKGEGKLVFFYKGFGAELEIGVYRKGRLLKTLVLKREEKGVFHERTSQGLEKLEARFTSRGRDREVAFFQKGDFEKVSARDASYYEAFGRRLQGGELYARKNGENRFPETL